MTVNLASSSKSQNTRTSSALFTAALQFALFCIRSETELANFKNNSLIFKWAYVWRKMHKNKVTKNINFFLKHIYI